MGGTFLGTPTGIWNPALGQYDVYGVESGGNVYWSHGIPGYTWSLSWGHILTSWTTPGSVVGVDLRPDTLEDVFYIVSGSPYPQLKHAVVETNSSGASGLGTPETVGSDVSAAANGVWNGAELDTYEVDHNNAPWSKVLTSSGWGSWNSLGSSITTTSSSMYPNLRMDGTSNEDVFVVSSGYGHDYVMDIGAITNASNTNIGGGRLVGPPSGVWNNATLAVYAIASTYIYRQTCSGGTWSGWTQLTSGSNLGGTNVSITVN